MTLAMLDSALCLHPQEEHPTAAELVPEENLLADLGHLDPLDRLTCPVHLTWIYRCVHATIHPDPLTGYCWCRPCRTPLAFAFDEVTGEATLHCPSCKRGAESAIDKRLVTSCERSYVAARAARAAA